MTPPAEMRERLREAAAALGLRHLDAIGSITVSQSARPQRAGSPGVTGEPGPQGNTARGVGGDRAPISTAVTSSPSADRHPPLAGGGHQAPDAPFPPELPPAPPEGPDPDSGESGRVPHLSATST